MQRLLATDAGLRERAIERCPDQLVRAAEQDSYDAVALLIELGFDVNARSRTAPLHEAAMRGNVAGDPAAARARRRSEHPRHRV